MICRNCGFQNAEGDEFCGSCGKFLEWTGDAGAASGADAAAAPTTVGADAPTTVEPTRPTAVAAGSGAAGAAGAATAGASTPGAAGGSLPGQAPVAGPPGLAPDVICWNCGRRNPASRAFCQQCGEKLTAGTAARAGGAATATVPSTPGGGGARGRLLVIGLAVIVVVALLGGGYAVFLSGAAPTPTPIIVVASPNPTGTTTGAGTGQPSSPSSSGAAPTTPGAATAGVSVSPTPTEVASPTEPTLPPTAPPTIPPTATATVEPTPTPTPADVGRFSCGDQQRFDPSPTKWLITDVTASDPGQFSRFEMTLERQHTGRADHNPDASALLLPSSEVQTRYGIPGPATGDIALVLILPSPISYDSSVDATPGLTSLSEYHVSVKGSTVYAVLGLTGTGCYQLSIPNWNQPPNPPSPAKLRIDIIHP